MEFPDLGKHCSKPACKQLDFLPMKCDACSRIFCKDHINYDTHGCEGLKKVTVCPLCNKPVPIREDEDPSVRVSEHIDRGCKSDRAVNKPRIYTNKCSRKGCKQKEIMPIICDSCSLNFCIKHRHTQDHACKGSQGGGLGMSKAGHAAMNRASSLTARKTINEQEQRPQRQRLEDRAAKRKRFSKTAIHKCTEIIPHARRHGKHTSKRFNISCTIGNKPAIKID